MSTMKRCISLLLVLCLLLSVAPVTVHAATYSGTCGETLTWTLSNDGVFTISGRGSMWDYSAETAPWYGNRSSITSVIINNSVTSIGDYAFFNCDRLSRVDIGDSVTAIGANAFDDCDSLSSVDIGDSMIIIGDYAFENCDKLSSVVIPDSVTTIGDNAFAYCDRLSRVDIGDSVTTIGRYAFIWCYSLSNVEIPDSVVTIGDAAFNLCDSLTRVEIPHSVVSIGNSSFGRCKSLLGIYVDVNNHNYSSDDCGVLFNKQKTALITAPGAIRGAYTIPDSVTNIGDYAFYNCESLRDVDIGDNVTAIGKYAFTECNSLSRVDIGDSVTTIGAYAFDHCDSLSDVDIGDSVVAIGDYAFRRCDSMNSVDIDGSVTTIGDYAFYECESLSRADIGDNVTTIGDYAFAYCKNLSDLDIGDSVTTISDYAFRHCDSINSVEISGSVTAIGKYAFAECGSLSSVEFQGDAPAISDFTFISVTAVAYYPANNPTWTSMVKKSYGGNITWVQYNANVGIISSLQSYSDAEIIHISPSVLDSAWSAFGPLSGVSLSCSVGEKIPIDGKFIIHRTAASAQEMILSKDGYRDYILPTEVAKTMREEDGIAYALTAYMQKDTKDGKPYISTVFGRESGSDNTYVDLRVTPLSVKEGSGSDIVVTAAGFGDQDVTYYLAQDSSIRFTSSSGVFTNEFLYHFFDDTSTVYAYAVGSDGTQTEPLAIKVDREEPFELAKELLDDSEWSFFGKDCFKITLSDDIPLLGGTELDISAFTFPVGISLEGDEMKISLGTDWFSSTEDADGYKWKAFKDLVIKQEEVNTETIDAFFKDYKKNYGENWKKIKKANKFNANVLGFVEGKWINGEFVIKEGQINLGGNFKFQWNAQGAWAGVPVYGTVEAGADFNAGGKVNRFLPDRDIPFEFTMLLNVAPKVKGGAGAGIKDAASAGLYAEGKMPLMIAFQEEHVKLDLHGEIGVEGELFLLHGRKALIEGDTNLIDWYYGTYDSPSDVSRVPVQNQTTTTVVSRDYAENTSAWLGDRGPALSIQSVGTKTTASRGVTFRELQNSIFSNSQPQLVTVGDRMLLVWVQDDATRDTYNRMRLVYSVYDSLGDSWSEPQPVWDDGHNDGYPMLASDGNQAYVLWQKINTTLTADNTTDVDTTIENSELCMARFDANAGTFADAQMLTDNDLYEYAHNVVLEKGEPVVYWAAADENTMDASGTNDLYCWIIGTESVLAQDLNYVLSIDACDGEVTYIADIDGNLSTTEDVTATTISDLGTEVFDNSELGTAVTYAGYAPFDGEAVLFLSDMRNIYYNHNGEVKSVLEESRAMDGNLNIVETDQGTTITWTETVDGWNEIYAVRYEDGKWSAPVMISESGKLLTKISATGYDGKLFGVCNANAVTYDEAAGDYVMGETNLMLFQASAFSDIALANYLNINENALDAGIETVFNVTVYNNGTKSVDEVTFTITDTLGTEAVQTVAVDIPSGGSETVTLTYPVPDGYTTTTLTVTAAIANGDAKESDNILSREIGNPDLRVNETAVEVHSDGYKITAVIENGSLVDAENVILSAFADEETTELLRSETIGTISRENYAIAEILVKNEALVYSENGTAKVYMKLESDDEEASGADNTLCVVVSEAAETVCMHPVTEQIAGLEPTCTEAGYKAYDICIACGEALGEATEIPARGHSYTALVMPPTCTEQGFTTYTCHCGDTYNSDYNTALGHDWDNGVVTVEPTEESKGEKLYTCKRCAETKVESIPVIGHEHRYEAAVIAPSCSEQGYTTYTCTCGESYVADYVPALGHSFGDWYVIQEPTTTEDGLEERSCTRCKHTEQHTIAKMDNPFSDVSEGSFYYEPVMWAVEEGITNGATETTYNPNGTCLRAQVVTFLHRADGNPEPTSTRNPFTDVKSSDFFYKPVLWAVEKGITNGISETTFGSFANCNRAAVVTFLWRAAGSPEPKSTDNPFVDVKTTDYFYKPVLWAVENGITNGVDATHFGPATDCNRAQVVTFLYRAYN